MIMRAIGVAVLAYGLTFAQATFEVASIKPAAPVEFGRTSVRRSVTKEKGVQGRLNYQGISLIDLIGDAYRVQRRQISGPDWLTSQRFDILALIPAAQNNDQIPEMLAAVLQARFKLKTHEETKEEQVYRLVVANNGPKLQKREKETGISGRSNKAANQVNAQTTLAHFADYLSERLGLPVVDQTGLTGVYGIQVEWAPDTAPATGVDAKGPSIFTALQEQMGLRLVSGKAPVRLVVVERIEKYPTDN